MERGADAGRHGEGEALWLRVLVCPIHRQPFSVTDDRLACPSGCVYPVIAGIPFLLPHHVRHTHSGIASRSFALADDILSGRRSAADDGSPDGIHSVVQKLVAGTNSNLYVSAIGRLTEYPIPPLPMSPTARGDLLLDIGCGWGRWSIAAARAGFRPVGIDPSLESALAAQSVARRLGVDARFVVADSRYLPFAPDIFDAAFSYSVLQHFSKEDVRATLRSLAVVMRRGGVTKLHMLNRYGLRSLQVQFARGFREAREFETRYWSPRELTEAFSVALGPSRLDVDGFFVQGRYGDRHLFKASHRLIVEISHQLTKLTALVPFLGFLADNVFVVSEVSA